VDDRLNILILEDVPSDAMLCERELRRAGIEFDSKRVETREAFEQALIEFRPDLIISDFSLPTAFDGMTALDLARAKVVDVPFIFVSGTIGEDRAVEAMRRGATDYVLKDRMQRLVPVVNRALQEARQRAVARQAQAALEESEERFRVFMQYLPGRASARDLDGRYVFVNELWCRTFGVQPEDVVGRRCDELWPPERSAPLFEIQRQLLESKRPVTRHVATGSADAQRWWVSLHFPIQDGSGDVRLIGTISIDVTEQKIQEQKLARLSRIRAILGSINSALMRIRDRERLLEEACRIAVDVGGFGVGWIGLVDQDTLDVECVAWAGVDAESLVLLTRNSMRSDSPLADSVVERALSTKRPVFRNDLLADPSPGGPRREEALRRGYRSVIALPLLVDDASVGVMSLLSEEPGYFTDEETRLLGELASDISFALDSIAKQEKLTYLAYYDPLTDLPNVALLQERLAQALSDARHRAGRVAVVVTDIKRFRHINETLGRHAGDALLCEFSRRLSEIMSGPGSLARLSADCFAAVLTNVGDVNSLAHLLGQPLSDLLARPFALEGQDIHVLVTVGIAVFPGDGNDAESLLRNAEAALKKAKVANERYLFYQPEMNARVADTLLLENRMRGALERREFVLHYQPKVVLPDATVSGVEALIRWNDPDTGLVSPGRFIPILEETGMILEAGEWALQRALTDHRSWQIQGLAAPRVAVNVSAIQLRRQDFVEVVRSALKNSSADAQALELEITESLIMENLEDTIPKLRELRAMGVSIAIDDFGTGYSSLSYLARLPVNTIKIDRSFIVTMVNEAESRVLVSSIISLAHSLRLNVVAEGVEHEEQARLLRILGCDEAQGYLYGKPQLCDEVAQYMAQGV
jgi:diguanylate cyclase (GGDEF)-like protein/PAS domain S-box-containing protein